MRRTSTRLRPPPPSRSLTRLRPEGDLRSRPLRSSSMRPRAHRALGRKTARRPVAASVAFPFGSGLRLPRQVRPPRRSCLVPGRRSRPTRSRGGARARGRRSARGSAELAHGVVPEARRSPRGGAHARRHARGSVETARQTSRPASRPRLGGARAADLAPGNRARPRLSPAAPPAAEAASPRLAATPTRKKKKSR